MQQPPPLHAITIRAPQNYFTSPFTNTRLRIECASLLRICAIYNTFRRMPHFVCFFIEIDMYEMTQAADDESRFFHLLLDAPPKRLLSICLCITDITSHYTILSAAGDFSPRPRPTPLATICARRRAPPLSFHFALATYDFSCRRL